MADLISMLAACGATEGEPTDPDFNQTVLLLHGDGTNGAQNNTFLDSSTNNFTITRNGNTTQGTFSPFSVGAGEWSNYFDGTTDNLSIADNAALELGGNNFFIEGWFNFSASVSATGYTLIAKAPSAFNSQAGFAFWRNTSNKLRFIFSTDGGGTNLGIIDTTNNFTPTVGQWYHLAVARSGTTFYIFIDGVSQSLTTSFLGTATSSSSIYDGTTALTIGSFSGNNLNFNGYASNIRLVNGSALYTATFTPSTSPLTTTSQGASSSQVELLTCQSNRFVDNSTNAFAITRNGDVRVTPFSPFAPSAAYDPAVNGGSGYFDGNGDYLSIASATALNLSSGDFTIEAWVYWNGSNSTATIVDKDGVSGSSYPSYSLSLNGSGFIRLNVGSGNGITSIQTLTSTTALPKNSWVHVAAVKNSTTLTIYQDGVSVASATQTATITDGGKAVLIGYVTGAASGAYLDGYISNCRIVKGTAVYTGAFTPPSLAPLSTSGSASAVAYPSTTNVDTSFAAANTSLLLNFTNAGIFDNTGKNNLETVADAQIDTTTKKFGTGSMEFDGTGDYLLLPNNVDQQLGTGNFTIEFWVYLASGDTGSARGLVAKGTSTTGWLVSLDSSEKVVFTYTTSTITSTGAITTNAWNYIAVVREGTGSNQTKIYINGSNDGTGTVSTDFNQTSVMYIGANRTGGDLMKGFIDDLRITKGIARTITTPTAAFPNE
jgi:hypothetical protein